MWRKIKLIILFIRKNMRERNETERGKWILPWVFQFTYLRKWVVTHENSYWNTLFLVFKTRLFVFDIADWHGYIFAIIEVKHKDYIGDFSPSDSCFRCPIDLRRLSICQMVQMVFSKSGQNQKSRRPICWNTRRKCKTVVSHQKTELWILVYYECWILVFSLHTHKTLISLFFACNALKNITSSSLK